MFFWLCKNCCSTMTLSFDVHSGLAILPISNTKRQSHVIGVTEARTQRVKLLRAEQALIGTPCDRIEGR